MQIMDYQQNTGYLSEKYTLQESIILEILNCVEYMMVVLAVSSIQALTVTMHSKWHGIIVSNTFIILAIYTMQAMQLSILHIKL